MRLSELTHQLARRAISGEHGRALQEADFTLADCGDLNGASENVKYALAVKLIAERAPLRVLSGELVAGSATLLEAKRHHTPVLGTYSTSHTTIGFGRVLEMGYKGLRRRIENRLQRGDLDDDGVDFLRSMLLCLDAAAIWHRRHAELLEERIEQSEGGERANCERVLAALRNVPENPPGTFHEALQSLWFMFAFQRLCGNWSGIGRIDEMLGPYLKKDIENGSITLDEARELLAHFWIKGCEWTDAKKNIGSGDAQHYQNIILAGVDSNGGDVANEVTYLVLDVVEELRISDFPIAVRISSRTPEKLLRRVAEVQRLGGGIVAVYNEDIVIRALPRFGYALEEARTFANDGCWEILIPGCTSFIYRPFDLLLLLQEVLGVCSPDAPRPECAEFDDLYAAFKEALSEKIRELHDATDLHGRNGPAAPLISLFVEDCIERARGYHDRGARYTVLAPHAGGLPDAANALLVIKKLVYTERNPTLAEFVNILRNDWEGNETLRRQIRSRFAFFGNDDPEADAMARRVFDDYVALVAEVRERNGVLRPAGLSTFGRQIEWTEQRGATAAGTRRGDLLANNFSPAPGTDKTGPTAVIKSFCSVDFEKLPNGTALELKIHPSCVKGKTGLAALVSFLKSFVSLGGVFLHIDVVDTKMLLDAQENPDKYPNLAVRVSGWSARFATLDKEWQDMIISRTQQEFR